MAWGRWLCPLGLLSGASGQDPAVVPGVTVLPSSALGDAETLVRGRCEAGVPEQPPPLAPARPFPWGAPGTVPPPPPGQRPPRPAAAPRGAPGGAPGPCPAPGRRQRAARARRSRRSGAGPRGRPGSPSPSAAPAGDRGAPSSLLLLLFLLLLLLSSHQCPTDSNQRFL